MSVPVCVPHEFAIKVPISDLFAQALVRFAPTSQSPSLLAVFVSAGKATPLAFCDQGSDL